MYLEDRTTRTWHRVDKVPVSFTETAGDITDRFVLHLGAVGVDETLNQPIAIQVYAYDKNLTISSHDNLYGIVKVVNILGQEMLSFDLSGENTQIQAVDAPTGYYLINIVTDRGVVNKKVYLK